MSGLSPNFFPNSGIQTRTPAVKIASGKVTKIEFERLDGLKSAILASKDVQTISNKIIDGTNNIHLDSLPFIPLTKVGNGTVNETNFYKLNGISSGIVALTDSQTISNKTLGNDLNANSYKIINVATPTANDDVATKQYVDTGILGLGGAMVSTVSTSDNLDTVIEIISTNTDETMIISANLVARRTDSGSESACYILKSCYRNNGGVLTQIGSDDITGFEDTIGWDIGTSISGTDVQIFVKGENSKTISWKCEHKLLIV